MEAGSFEGGGSIREIRQDRVQKSLKLVDPLCRSGLIGGNTESTKSGKDFMKSLEQLVFRLPTWVDDVCTLRPSDCIPIGMHLQKILPLVVAKLVAIDVI